MSDSGSLAFSPSTEAELVAAGQPAQAARPVQARAQAGQGYFYPELAAATA